MLVSLARSRRIPNIALEAFDNHYAGVTSRAACRLALARLAGGGWYLKLIPHRDHGCVMVCDGYELKGSAERAWLSFMLLCPLPFCSFGCEAVQRRLHFCMVANVTSKPTNTPHKRLKRSNIYWSCHYNNNGHLIRTWNNETISIDHSKKTNILA